MEVEDNVASYYVNDNAQANGDHEVHREGCSFMPSQTNRTYLGQHDDCRSAVVAASGYYQQVNGCYYCSRECHTG